ncbi:hypothetical protein B0H11DRAFT_2089657 [Mycena galericulata]|nr:hypothetical protein B0H11DRAFT_2089657 [Mycena galericulata]
MSFSCEFKTLSSRGKCNDFLYGRVHRSSTGPLSVCEADPRNVIVINLNAASVSTDLVTLLSTSLTAYNSDGLHLPEMLTFHITVDAACPLIYPPCLYMDQFLVENLELVVSQHRIKQELEALMTRRQNLTLFQGKDPLQNVRETIYYYENIADPQRCSEAVRAAMVTRLENYLFKWEREIEDIDRKTSILQSKLDALFANPQLRCHPYDLHEVSVDTDIPDGQQDYMRDGNWRKPVYVQGNEVRLH